MQKDFETFLHQFPTGTPLLILIRGVPGTGKSTFAKSLLPKLTNGIHLEADMWFHKETGNYDYDGDFIKSAHRWCLNSTKIFLRNNHQVVVANTFITLDDTKEYIDFAKSNNIPIYVFTRMNAYGSIHSVTAKKMQSVTSKLAHHYEILNYIEGK